MSLDSGLAKVMPKRMKSGKKIIGYTNENSLDMTKIPSIPCPHNIQHNEFEQISEIKRNSTLP